MHIVAYITSLLFLVLLLAPGRLTGLASTELALTNKRILGRVGMFRRKYISLPYKLVSVVKSRRGILGHIFNYGTIIISSHDGMRYRLRGIAYPLDFELQCNEYTEIAVLGRSLSKAPATDTMPRPKPIITRDAPPLETHIPVMEKPVQQSPVLQQPDESKLTAKNRKDPNAW